MKLPQFFGKWITENEHNLDFATASGYLPVTEDAFSTHSSLTWELLKMRNSDAL